MPRLDKVTTVLIAALLLALLWGMVAAPLQVLAAHPTVDLLTADSFAVLAGAQVADSNPSLVSGNVGLSPASGSFIDITCAEVNGTIYAVDAAGPAPCAVENLGLLTQAKNDLTTAYNDAAGRPATTIATELGGETLVDGTYDSASTTFEIVSGGTLTLDGEGNPDAVFIFKMGSTLTTFSASTVALINQAQACNVFWQVGSSAVLGTGTTFVGTIMADQSITDNGGSTIDGRLLARIAAVTLNNTTLTRSDCEAATSTPTSTSTATSTTTSTATSTATSTDQSPVDATATRSGGGGGGGGGDGGGAATSTSVLAELNTPVLALTATSAALTATADAILTQAATGPAIVGLPQAGGGPLIKREFPWSQALPAGGLGVLALGLGFLVVRRRARRPVR